MKRFAKSLIAVLIAVPGWAAVQESDVIRVWDDSGRGKGKVCLKAYVPPEGSRTGKAVIVCPGGSYFWLAEVDEGEKVGELLCDRGVAAFVLSYRVAGKFNFVTDFRALFNGNRYPDMLDDAQRAIRIVRNMAPRYGIDGNGIGIMGFSAGGHLAMLSEEIACRDSSGVRSNPDFVAMIYPVVTMSDPAIVHKRSRRGLLGSMAGNKTIQDSLSLEKHVPADCCPVFILHCEDDPVVDFRNSAVLDSVLTAGNIRHEFVSASAGGHGFGIKEVEKDGKSHSWIDDFLSWLRKLT